MSIRKTVFNLVERLQPVSSALGGMIEGQDHHPTAPALAIFNGSIVGARTILPLLAERSASVICAVAAVDRSKQLESTVGESASILVGAPLNLELPTGLGFVAVVSGTAQMRDTFEE